MHHDAENGWPASLDLSRFDCFLVVDTGTWSQLPGLQERISSWKVPKLVLDHHLTQENWADAKLVVSEAAAAGEIAAELMDLWQVALDGPIASVSVPCDRQRYRVVPIFQHAGPIRFDLPRD